MCDSFVENLFAVYKIMELVNCDNFTHLSFMFHGPA
jgi:hypothetical protein